MSVKLTDAAAVHIKNALAKNPKAIGFRLGVKNAGCASKKFEPSFVEETQSEDHCFTDHDITIYVHPADLPYVSDTTIDYVRDGLNYVFKYHNPNITITCGCGESFDSNFSPSSKQG